MKPTGLVLAGGLGRRMGKGTPKPLRRLAGRPLVAASVDALSALCDQVLISTGDAPAYAFLGLDILADRRPGHAGPLSGIEAGLLHLAQSSVDPPPDEEHRRVLLVVPGDTPFVRPQHLAPLIERARTVTKPCVARSADRLQPTVCVWPCRVLPLLTAWLDAGRPRAIRAFLDEIGFTAVDIPMDAAAPDGNPFFNVNRPEDLEIARRTRPLA